MANCLSPFVKKDTGIPFPCGKCYQCKQRRVSGWSFRLLKEAERSCSAFFVTLTYDSEHMPLTSKTYMTLFKRHLTLWFKKLRKINDTTLKYYAVGEYGGKSKRPHYHVILFNASLESLIGYKYMVQHRLGNIILDGKMPHKCTTWEHGHITVGQLTEASCAYTLKYISKASKIPEHKNDDRIPEFSNMSKGMGLNYVTEQQIEFHRADLNNRYNIGLKDGKKISMPRYYKKHFYTENERDDIHKHLENQELMEYQKLNDEQKKNLEYNRIAKGLKNDDYRKTKI